VVLRYIILGANLLSKIKKFFTKTVYYEVVPERVDNSKRTLLKKIGAGAIIAGALLANSNPVTAMTFNSKVKQQHDMQINGVSGWKLKSDGKVYLNQGTGVDEIDTEFNSTVSDDRLVTEKAIDNNNKKFRIRAMYDQAYSTHHKKFTYNVAEEIEKIEVFNNVSETTKLFTRDITYNSEDEPIQILTTNNLTSESLTETVNYTGDEITSITGVYA